MNSMRTWILVLSGIGSLMVALDSLVVATALSTIRTDLGASIEELEWTVNAYNLSFAVLLMTAAALGDRFGRRRLYAGGLLLFVTASAACALAPDVGWLIAARAVQGVGAAFVMSLGLALLATAFPPEKRGVAMGLHGAITGIAVASGPTIGGAIVEGIAWEWIFWVNVPLGLATIPFVFGRVKESYGPDTAVDTRGVVLVTASAFAVVWGLMRGNRAGWDSFEVLTSLASGVVLVVAFVRWQMRAPAPMLPPSLFRLSGFSSGNAAIFFLFASLVGTVFLFAQFMQVGLGSDPLESGLRLIPWTGTLLVCAPIAGALADRVGSRPFMGAGLVIQAAGFAWIAMIADPGMAYSELIAPMIVAGCGISMAIPASQNAVVSSVGSDTIGQAAGTNSTMRELGAVLGVAVVVAVFSGAGSYASPAEFTDGFVAAMVATAALALVGAIVGLALSARRMVVAPALAEQPARP